MAVKIRLTRKGRRNLPFYRIGVFDVRTKRDGKAIEYLGTYNPLEPDEAKKYVLKKDRAEYWLSVGAKPTVQVWNIMKKQGLKHS